MSGKQDQKKLVYICAPLRGDVAGNIERARGYCKAVLAMGAVPISPHVMLAGVLNDEIPAERQTALEIGLELLTHCAELWVFSGTVSEGMRAEIELAKRRGIPVVTVCFDFERQSTPGAEPKPASGTETAILRRALEDAIAESFGRPVPQAAMDEFIHDAKEELKDAEP